MVVAYLSETITLDTFMLKNLQKHVLLLLLHFFCKNFSLTFEKHWFYTTS